MRYGPFTNGDLQVCVALISEAKLDGVITIEEMEIRLMRMVIERRGKVRLSDEGRKFALEQKRVKRKDRAEIAKQETTASRERCPSCNRSFMYPATKDEWKEGRRVPMDEPVMVCPSCHYSEYKGVN